MIHQPSGGSQGKATDMQIIMEHMLKTKEKLHRIYSEITQHLLIKLNTIWIEIIG